MELRPPPVPARRRGPRCGPIDVSTTPRCGGSSCMAALGSTPTSGGPSPTACRPPTSVRRIAGATSCHGRRARSRRRLGVRAAPRRPSEVTAGTAHGPATSTRWLVWLAAALVIVFGTPTAVRIGLPRRRPAPAHALVDDARAPLRVGMAAHRGGHDRPGHAGDGDPRPRRHGAVREHGAAGEGRRPRVHPRGRHGDGPTDPAARHGVGPGDLDGDLSRHSRPLRRVGDRRIGTP